MNSGNKDESIDQQLQLQQQQPFPSIIPQLYRYVQSPVPFYFGFPETIGSGSGGSVHQQDSFLLSTAPTAFPSATAASHQGQCQFFHSQGDLSTLGLLSSSTDSGLYSGQIPYGFMIEGCGSGQVGATAAAAAGLYPLNYAPYVEDFASGLSFAGSVGNGLRSSGSSSSLDMLTPYSSEVEPICGTSSSGSMDNKSSPTRFEPQSVRPLDVITPELFQAIHAPAFYKTANQQHAAMYYAPTMGTNFYDSHSHSHSSGYSTTPSQKGYVPPVNSLSSITCAPTLASSCAATGASVAAASEAAVHGSARPFNSTATANATATAMKPSKFTINAHHSHSPAQKASSASGRANEGGRSAAVAAAAGGNSSATVKDMLPTVVGADGKIYQKPPGSYASLITRALSESPDGKLTLSGIYEWIKANYPYYQAAEAAWQVHTSAMKRNSNNSFVCWFACLLLPAFAFAHSLIPTYTHSLTNNL